MAASFGAAIFISATEQSRGIGKIGLFLWLLERRCVAYSPQFTIPDPSSQRFAMKGREVDSPPRNKKSPPPFHLVGEAGLGEESEFELKFHSNSLNHPAHRFNGGAPLQRV